MNKITFSVIIKEKRLGDLFIEQLLPMDGNDCGCLLTVKGKTQLERYSGYRIICNSRK